MKAALFAVGLLLVGCGSGAAETFPIVGTPVPNQDSSMDAFARWTDKGLVVGVPASSSCYPAPSKLDVGSQDHLTIEFISPARIDGNTATELAPGTACTADFTIKTYVFDNLPMPNGTPMQVTTVIKRRGSADAVSSYEVTAR